MYFTEFYDISYRYEIYVVMGKFFYILAKNINETKSKPKIFWIK